MQGPVGAGDDVVDEHIQRLLNGDESLGGLRHREHQRVNVWRWTRRLGQGGQRVEEHDELGQPDAIHLPLTAEDAAGLGLPEEHCGSVALQAQSG